MKPIRTEYPRPQLKRESWTPLNGEWEFAFDDAEEGIIIGYPTGKIPLPLRINVPFSYQCAASGLGDVSEHPVVWYRRSFFKEGNRRVLLCFNGCDYETDVWVSGHHAGSHKGAYTPFELDITPYLREGENFLVVRCRDGLDTAQPRGKQSWKGEPFSCWYTPTTGIWQSVWFEYFDEDCVSELSLLADLDGFSFGGELETRYGLADCAEIEVSFRGKKLCTEQVTLEGKLTRYRVALTPMPEAVWSPAHPALLDVKFSLFRGKVKTDILHTRFGMRKVVVDGEGNLLLNGEKFYQRLVLDQGYWPESGLTPPSAEALRKDIEYAMAMGFNGARKHQKIEDPYYDYYAEELGFLTWCEMPSAYAFHTREMMALTEEWMKIVARARNHTSNICYVPFNESWGVGEICNDCVQQDFVRAVYLLTRSLDPTRPISANDGWECLDMTDIIGIHDYAFSGENFKEKYSRDGFNGLYPQGRKLMAHGCDYAGQPVILTEFGGIAMKADTEGDGWGYNECACDKEEFYARYRNLLEGVYASSFQGFCYTQLTDVQQEVNGLLSHDRKPKFELFRLKELNEEYGRRKL